MPGQIPMEDIVDKVVGGIGNAQEDYKSWSKGYWLTYAPEYVITTSIARSISTLSNEGNKCPVLLENNVKDVMENACGESRGRYHSKLRSDGKFDIVVCWADETPRAVIEVKHNIWYFKRPKKDLDRIKEALKRKPNNTNMQFGIFAFYIACESKNREDAIECIKNKIDYLYKESKKFLGEDYSVTLKTGKYSNNAVDEYAWEAVALLIQRK